MPLLQLEPVGLILAQEVESLHQRRGRAGGGRGGLHSSVKHPDPLGRVLSDWEGLGGAGDWAPAARPHSPLS